jgi:hypothetical protein
LWTDIITSCAALDELRSVSGVRRSQVAEAVYGGLPIPVPVVTRPDAMSLLGEVPLFEEQAWSCLIDEGPTSMLEFHADYGADSPHMRFFEGNTIEKLTSVTDAYAAPQADDLHKPLCRGERG